jgi:hypothetical protein
MAPEPGLQFFELAGGPLDPESPAVRKDHSGRVITPVFEAPQTLQQDLQRRPITHIAHDTAHG